jgi:hypothetical protein
VNPGKPLPIADTFGELQNLFQNGPPFLAASEHPEHIHLLEAQIDPLSLALRGRRELVYAHHGIVEVAAGLHRGETGDRSISGSSEVAQGLLSVARLLVMVGQQLHLFMEAA